MSELKRSAYWFIIVGATAAATHYSVAVGLEAGTRILPTWANLAGFLCSFPVSYIGHQRFSFLQQKAQHRQALPRFFALACAGFVGNQLLLIATMHFTALPFWLVLGMVMVVIAFSTYLLSRHWAFRSQ